MDLKKIILASDGGKLAISNLACNLLYPKLYLDYENVMPEIEKCARNEKLYIEF
jgi:hypothetical protein